MEFVPFDGCERLPDLGTEVISANICLHQEMDTVNKVIGKRWQERTNARLQGAEESSRIFSPLGEVHAERLCEHIPGRQFRSGSYKCMCRQGFEYPFNDLTWFFDGETMEKEYELMVQGQPSRYDLLKCRQGHAMALQTSVGIPYRYQSPGGKLTTAGADVPPF
ncbi:hypothetical protein TSMEX_007066 [Taenia solium]|eukprot:TsM_001157500 transcript=TsM_001157500 gene=TsM_001157500